LIDSVFVSSSMLFRTGAKLETSAMNGDLASEPNETLFLTDSKDNVNN
jgi:hypothetical protein